ncbi:MAG: hypothetical protein ACKVUS_20845 [Saprospiraceae bacterium]
MLITRSESRQPALLITQYAHNHCLDNQMREKLAVTPRGDKYWFGITSVVGASWEF